MLSLRAASCARYGVAEPRCALALLNIFVCSCLALRVLLLWGFFTIFLLFLIFNFLLLLSSPTKGSVVELKVNRCFMSFNLYVVVVVVVAVVVVVVFVIFVLVKSSVVYCRALNVGLLLLFYSCYFALY